MALITERGYFYTELGVGVGGIEVNAYAKLTDGTWGGTVLATTTSASGSGKWEFVNLDTALSTQTGIFAIRFRNPSTGQIRKRDGDESFQVGTIVGASGVAPFPDGSVTGPKILDGAVTDAKLGNRTADPTLGSPASTGTLTQLLGWITGRIKAISGTTNWYDAPATTIAALNTAVAALVSQAASFTAHLSNTSNPHATTAAQVGAVANASNVVKAYSGLTSARPAAATAGNGALYFSTDDQQVSFSNGSTWTTLGVVDYNDLINLPTIPGSPNLFSQIAGINANSATTHLTVSAGPGISLSANDTTKTLTINNDAANNFTQIKVGASTATADQESDAFTFVAGTGIGLSLNTSTDSLTISNTGTDATTVRGNDGDLYPFLKGIAAISGSAPGLTTGPWMIQAGRVSLSGGRSAGAFTINLSPTVTGFVTAIVIPEKGYDAGGVAIGTITVNISGYTTGASPKITGDTEIVSADISGANIQNYNEAMKLNYFVIHW